MPEQGETRYFRFGKFDGSRPEAGAMQNPLQLRDGVGNSRLQEILQEFAGHYTLGKTEDLPAMNDLLSCFAPVGSEFTTKATAPMPDETFTTLKDQIGDVYKSYNDLGRKEQKQVVNLTQYLVRSIAQWPHERKIRGEDRALSPHVHEMAEKLLAREDIWKGQAIKPADTREIPRNALPGQVNVRFAALLLEVTAIASLLSGCRKYVDVFTPTPGGAPAEVTMDPTLETAIFIPSGAESSPTVIASPIAALTETPSPVSPEVAKPPDALPGVMPTIGLDLQPNALTSAVQQAINELNYGVVYADGNVSKSGNQVCISVVPEQISNKDTGAAESLAVKDLDSTQGVAKYSGGTQVLGEVALPPDTADAAYSCAMTYNKEDGVLYQMLIRTNKADGSVEVVASMPAAFSKDDAVKFTGGAVTVNGEQLNWTYMVGKEPLATQAEIQQQFENVLTDPWNATEAQKTEFDTYMTNWWHQTLKAAGVENAESLAEYDLLEAIINYEQTQPVDANRVVYLPFSLHKLLRTDIDNIVGYHIDEKTGKGYGIGEDISPTPSTEELIQYFINPQPDVTFYGEPIHLTSAQLSVSGDLVLLFQAPGFTTDQAVGGVIRMYDENGKSRYVEFFTPLIDLKTRASDTCVNGLYGVPCKEGVKISQSYLINKDFPSHTNNSLEYMFKFLRTIPNPYIEINNPGNSAVWTDGSEIAINFYIFDAPENFFEN